MGFASTRAALAIAVATAGLAAAGTMPAHADSSAYQTLAGVNTINTSTSGVATVRLTQPATFSFKKQLGPGGNYVFGEGRAVGLILEHAGHVDFGRVLLADCNTAGCTGTGHLFLTLGFSPRLQPGLYHIYVIADGAPVTANLSLDGLPGRTALQLSPSSDITVGSLSSLVPSTPVGTAAAFSAGGSGTVGSNGGLALSFLLMWPSNDVAGYFRACAAQGAAPPVWTPGCDAPQGSSTLDQVTYTGNELAYPYLVCVPPYCDSQWTLDEVQNGSPWPWLSLAVRRIDADHAGQWGLGSYFYGPAVMSSTTATGVWLSYLPQESDQSAAPQTSTTQSPSTPNPNPPASATPTPTPAATPIGLPNTTGGPGPGTAATIAAFTALLLLLRRRRRAARLATLAVPVHPRR